MACEPVYRTVTVVPNDSHDNDFQKSFRVKNNQDRYLMGIFVSSFVPICNNLSIRV